MNALALRFSILLLSAIGLTACGFKLAGTANLPPELSAIYLSADSLNKPQQNALRRRLANAGASFVSRDDENAVILTVSIIVQADRRLASSGSNGKTVERVARSLDFSLKSVDGTQLVAATSLHQQKNLESNDDSLLASNQEKQRVVEALEKSLFDQMIRQLIRI